jgi:hypothetical protein
VNEEKTNKLIELATKSYENSQRNLSKIANDWRVMDQYSVSSKKFKNLLSNLCSLENCCYLELGCFRGGTLTAALMQNKLLAAYAVDNFTYNPLGQHKDPETGKISSYNPDGWPNVKLNLIENLEKLSLDKSVKVFMGDWDKISPTFIKHKLNIIHLDIPHKTNDILNFYDNKFDDVFILVVTNYNEREIREDVDKYISDKKYEGKHKITTYSASNADTEGWWNGVSVMVIQKQNEVLNEKKVSNQPNQL